MPFETTQARPHGRSIKSVSGGQGVGHGFGCGVAGAVGAVLTAILLG